MSLPSIFPSASRIFSKPTARPTSPSPSSSFWATARIAWPPVAQAFSTLSIGLRVEPGRHGEETREQPLLVERQVADGADRGDVDGRAFGLHRGAGLLGGAHEDLGHRHPEELAELRLVVGGDVDRLHENPPFRSVRDAGASPGSGCRARKARRRSSVSRGFSDDEGVAAPADDGELAAREPPREGLPAFARHRPVAFGQEHEDRAGDLREERRHVEPLERAEEAGEALEPGVREVRHEDAARGDLRRRARRPTPGRRRTPRSGRRPSRASRPRAPRGRPRPSRAPRPTSRPRRRSATVIATSDATRSGARAAR